MDNNQERTSMDLRSLRLKKFAIGDRTIAYGMDGSIIPRALCAMCGNNYELKEKDRKDIARTIGDHLRHYHKDIFQGTFPSLPDLRLCTSDFLPTGIDQVTTIERNMILLQADPLFNEVAALLERNNFIARQEKIAVVSWLPLAKCSSLDRNSVTLDGWYRGFQGWIGTATTEQWEILTNNDAAKEQAIMETQRSVMAAAQRILKGNTAASVPPLSQSTSFTESSTTSGQASSTVETGRMAVEEAEVNIQMNEQHAFVHVGTNLVMRLDGSGKPTGLICPGKDNTVGGGLYVDNFRIRHSAYEDVRERRPRPPKRIIGPVEQKQNKLFRIMRANFTDESGTIAEDAKRRSAYLTRDLERHGRDWILVEACEAFLETGCTLLDRWHTVEKARLNEVFTGFSHNPVSSPSAADINDLLSGGLNTNLHAQTIREYGTRLAKCVRIYMEEEIGHYHLMEGALLDVMACQEREALHGGDIWKTKEFKDFVAEVSRMFYLIACNPHLIINQVLQHFLFFEVTRPYHDDVSAAESGGDDESEQEDEDVSANEPRTRRIRTDPELGGEKMIRVRKSGTIKTICAACMFALKMAVGLEIEYHRIQLRQPLTAKVTLVETDTPFEKVLAQFRSPEVNNHKALAYMMAALGALDRDSSGT